MGRYKTGKNVMAEMRDVNAQLRRGIISNTISLGGGSGVVVNGEGPPLTPRHGAALPVPAEGRSGRALGLSTADGDHGGTRLPRLPTSRDGSQRQRRCAACVLPRKDLSASPLNKGGYEGTPPSAGSGQAFILPVRAAAPVPLLPASKSLTGSSREGQIPFDKLRTGFAALRMTRSCLQ